MNRKPVKSKNEMQNGVMESTWMVVVKELQLPTREYIIVEKMAYMTGDLVGHFIMIRVDHSQR